MEPAGLKFGTSNFCSVDFFEWTPTSPGWVALSETESWELDIKTMALIDSQEKMEIQHLPFQIQEESTPSGRTIKVLRLEFPEWSEGLYGLVDTDPALHPKPHKLLNR